MQARVRETVLDNGLKVLVQEVHTAPLASVWCWYRVGSRDEGPGVTGVSHWVEHMNFKGTANIPRDQVKGIIEQFGGSWNGYTWVDQTTYLETASTDALDRMLFIEAERMDKCLYDPSECESERTVIISELQGGENDPEQLLDMEVTATAFKVHPYRHPTIGWQSDVETMTREDLFGHYKRYYTPSNATIVIVGDVETDDAVRRVERQFGSIAANGTPVRRRAVEPRQEAERRVTLRKEGTTAYWKAAYHAPAFGDASFFPLLVADAVLSGGAGLNIWSAGRVARPQRSSRLYRRVVDSGLASSVHGALMPTAQPFLYSVSVTVSAGRTLASVEDAVLDELDRFLEKGVTEAELEKAKAQLRARFVFDMDGVTDIAHQLGYFETIGSWRDAVTLRDRLSEVTLADVHDVARRVFAASNRTIGWFEPQADTCR
jgi:zinc protease